MYVSVEQSIMMAFSAAFNLEIVYAELNCPWARAERVCFRFFLNFILFLERPDVFCILNLLVKANLSLNTSPCDLCRKARRKETLIWNFY